MTATYLQSQIFIRFKKMVKSNFSYSIALAILFTMNSCHKIHDHVFGEIVYVESNDYHDNQNAIWAFKHTGDGKPEQIPGSPFYTRGAGISNPTEKLGPDDTETPIIVYKNKFLIAVNEGSNTIAVLKINSDGSLEHIQGSPFPSGGETPASLYTSGNFLYVANKSDNPMYASKVAPNYSTFIIEEDGKITPVPGGKFETFPGSSPAQVLVSNDNKFVFGADVLAGMLEPPQGTLRSFTRNNAGLLTPVEGTPYTIPEMGFAQGLWQHPHANVLYVGFPLAAKMGIYTIDEATGALTFNSSVDGGLATCWIRVTKDGKYLFTLNSAENTISVYNSSNPIALVFIQKFTLKNSGPLYPGLAPGTMFTTSEDFHLSLSGSDKYLYVVCQHTNKDFTIGSYNFLHTLPIAQDGSLSEPQEPVHLPVSADIRPQGVAIY